MIHRTIVASLLIAVFGIVADSRDASAGDYVWARTNWGNLATNRPVSAMGNGYGGYYVPRNAYGNNYEGQRFTNPNGYIIPANSGQAYQPPQRRGWLRRR